MLGNVDPTPTPNHLLGPFVITTNPPSPHHAIRPTITPRRYSDSNGLRPTDMCVRARACVCARGTAGDRASNGGSWTPAIVNTRSPSTAQKRLARCCWPAGGAERARPKTLASVARGRAREAGFVRTVAHTPPRLQCHRTINLHHPVTLHHPIIYTAPSLYTATTHCQRPVTLPSPARRVRATPKRSPCNILSPKSTTRIHEYMPCEHVARFHCNNINTI